MNISKEELQKQRNREQAKLRYWKKRGYDEIPPREQMYGGKKIVKEKKIANIEEKKMVNTEEKKLQNRKNYWKRQGFDDIPPIYLHKRTNRIPKLTLEEKRQRKKESSRRYYWINVKGCSEVPKETRYRKLLTQADREKRKKEYIEQYNMKQKLLKSTIKN